MSKYHNTKAKPWRDILKSRHRVSAFPGNIFHVVWTFARENGDGEPKWNTFRLELGQHELSILRDAVKRYDLLRVILKHTSSYSDIINHVRTCWALSGHIWLYWAHRLGHVASYKDILAHIGSIIVLFDHTETYGALASYIRSCWDKLDHVGLYWFILGHTDSYSAILGHTRPYRAILDHAEISWIILAHARSILGHIGSYWFILGHTG